MRDPLFSAEPQEEETLDFPAALHFAKIRAHSKCGAGAFSPALFIAAHALSLALTLVTNNPRKFRRVPKLLLENWTR